MVIHTITDTTSSQAFTFMAFLGPQHLLSVFTACRMLGARHSIPQRRGPFSMPRPLYVGKSEVLADGYHFGQCWKGGHNPGFLVLFSHSTHFIPVSIVLQFLTVRFSATLSSPFSRLSAPIRSLRYQTRSDIPYTGPKFYALILELFCRYRKPS